MRLVLHEWKISRAHDKHFWDSRASYLHCVTQSDKMPFLCHTVTAATGVVFSITQQGTIDHSEIALLERRTATDARLKRAQSNILEREPIIFQKQKVESLKRRVICEKILSKAQGDSLDLSRKIVIRASEKISLVIKDSFNSRGRLEDHGVRSQKSFHSWHVKRIR